MKPVAALFALALCAAPALAEEPVSVMVVGLFHMSNPGHDLNNVKADDVLAPKRQAELAAVTAALGRFKPTRVAVEWEAAVSDERYAQYKAGTLKPSRNEVVQLGFRLAKEQGLAQVDGIDVEGQFPFEAMQAYAQTHGQQAILDEAMKQGAAAVAAIDAHLASGSIGSTLAFQNQPKQIAKGNDFYRLSLKIGGGTEQPGVALLSAWYERNFRICANLVQRAKPGDRVVVFYGAGHAHLLRQCVSEMPGYRLVEANYYLPQ